MVHSVTALSSNTHAVSALSQDPGGREAVSSPFEGTIRDAIGQINALDASASQAVSGLLKGTGVDIHQAMIAAQKASMAFEMALAIRNKAVQAYQSVMQLQF